MAAQKAVQKVFAREVVGPESLDGLPHAVQIGLDEMPEVRTIQRESPHRH